MLVNSRTLSVIVFLLRSGFPLICFNVLESSASQHVVQIRKAMRSLLSEVLTFELEIVTVHGILFNWDSSLSQQVPHYLVFLKLNQYYMIIHLNVCL